MSLLAFFWLGCAAAAALTAVGVLRALRGEALLLVRLRRRPYLLLARRGERYELVTLARAPGALLRAAAVGLLPGRAAAAQERPPAPARPLGAARRIPVPAPHRA